MIKIKNKKFILLLILSAVLFLSGILLLINREYAISVIEHIGSVIMSKISIHQEVDVYDGMRMEEGDTIRTGKESSALMEIDENKIIKMGEFTNATFEELKTEAGNSVTKIFMDSGTLFNDIKKKLEGNDSYTVTTPNSTVSVRGTYFVIRVGDDPVTGKKYTQVSVYDGTVKMTYLDENGQQKEIFVDKGNECTIKDEAAKITQNLDYSQFDEEQLERLLELAIEKNGKVGYQQEEIEEQIKYKKVKTVTTKDVIVNSSENSLDSSNNDSSQPEETTETPPQEETPVQTPPEEIKQQEIVPELPKEEVPLVIEEQKLPEGEILPEEQQQQENIILPNPKQYASYQPQKLVVEGVEEAEELYQSINERKETFSEKQLEEIGWSKVQQIHEQVENIKKANEILDAINGLSQPAEITVAEKDDVYEARSMYRAASEEIKKIIPEVSLSKLSDCEESLSYVLGFDSRFKDKGLEEVTEEEKQDFIQMYSKLSQQQRQELSPELVNTLVQNNIDIEKVAEEEKTNKEKALEEEQASKAEEKIEYVASENGNDVIFQKETGSIEEETIVKTKSSAKSIDLKKVDNQKKIQLSVVSTKEVPVETIKSDLNEDMEIIACYDIKLMALSETGEQIEVQPKDGSKIDIMIQVPKEYEQSQNFAIWHVKGKDNINSIGSFETVKENDVLFLKFEVDSFSQFVVAALKKVAESKSFVSVTVAKLQNSIDRLINPDYREPIAYMLFVVSFGLIILTIWFYKKENKKKKEQKE